MIVKVTVIIGRTTPEMRPNYLTDTENTKIIEVVQQITKKYEDANFKVYLAGSSPTIRLSSVPRVFLAFIKELTASM
jgi:hypothetical protein